MNFGEAIDALQKGELLQRTGWNGKGLFVFMQIPAIIPSHIIPNMQSLPEKVKQEFMNRFQIPWSIQEIYYSNQLAIVDLNNNIKGWTPSVSDSLADDWVIYTVN